MLSSRRIARFALIASLLVALPAARAADTLPLRLAIEISPTSSLRGRDASARDVARLVATHLPPLFEAEGFDVVRVEDVSQAARSGRYHAAVRLSVDARPIRHVRSARASETKEATHLDVDFSESVEVWGRWEAFDGMTGRRLDGDRIERFGAQLQSAGVGGAELDDPESVARLMADSAHRALSGALAGARALRP